MTTFDVLQHYEKHLHKFNLNVNFEISKEMRKIKLPFSMQSQLGILDLIIIYYHKKIKNRETITLSFTLEVHGKKCLIVIKPRGGYETFYSVEAQEFFWVMHLIFRDMLIGKSIKVWGIFAEDKFKVQIPMCYEDG